MPHSVACASCGTQFLAPDDFIEQVNFKCPNCGKPVIEPLAACLGCGCLAALVMILLAIGGWFKSGDHGETKPVTVEMIEKTRKHGAKVGREEGWRAGEAEGFAASFRSAEKEAYEETIDELYESGKFRRVRLYTFAAAIGFFFLGFTLQWIVLYVLRRLGLLTDIDWIVLPKEMTQVDLYDLSVSLSTKSERSEPPTAWTTLILLLTLLPMIGCKNREQDPWQQGYEASRSVAYQAGWREGARRGEKEGRERGKAEGEHATQTGRAWQLYTTLAFLALMFGSIVGIALQYTVLACCNDAGRVPEMCTVAFVPAMKHSLAYSVLVKRRKLQIWLEGKMELLAAVKKINAVQIQTVHDTILRRMKAKGSLRELKEARLLELAEYEMSKVVADAEQKATESATLIVTCPHCGKKVRYPRKKAGKTVNCPNPICNRPFQLPVNADGS